MATNAARAEECPFCRANNLLDSDILAENGQAFLIRNKLSPATFLIIPDAHYESLLDLPDGWWADLKQMLQAVPDLLPDYNLSINIGKQAGQTLGHLHFWIIPRPAGAPASGKGLAKLIDEANVE
jgi:histidine triad (HIT) family protein